MIVSLNMRALIFRQRYIILTQNCFEFFVAASSKIPDFHDFFPGLLCQISKSSDTRTV